MVLNHSRPTAVDWNGLQAQFRQQYSKIERQQNNFFVHADHSTSMKIQKL